MVALGTHAPMSDDAIGTLVGQVSFPVRNHAWWEDDTFTHLGRCPRRSSTNCPAGGCSDTIDVRINRLVVESDVTLIVGPVLPHEVIGFSGGNKYLFPGLSGEEMIDVTHWLGALITSREIIGTRGVTPVRALVDAAAELVPVNGTRCAWWWTTTRVGCGPSPSVTPRRRGRRRRTSRPRPTSSISTTPSSGCSP